MANRDRWNDPLDWPLRIALWLVIACGAAMAALIVSGAVGLAVAIWRAIL